MATNGDKKLTRYTSAVTVVTAEVMNALYGGEYPDNIALYEEDQYHPLVAGHIHDGEHSDGHASKVLLTNAAHVRGVLSHTNLGGTGDTDPAVQKTNIQCYAEDVYGGHGGAHAIPEYEVDPVTGNRCYYLDLSMTVGGDNTYVQFNKGGDFGGDSGFTYDYAAGKVGIGVPSPSAELHVAGDGLFSGDLSIGGKLTVAGLIDPTGLVLSEEDPINVPTGDGFGAIFISNGNGSDGSGSGLQRNKLYYKDQGDNVTSLAPSGLVGLEVTSWPDGGGGITLGQEVKKNFVIISGQWDGLSQVVIPDTPADAGHEWETGDSFWIKNMSFDGTIGVSSPVYNYVSITISGNSSQDTLDGDPLMSGYVLPPKSTIQVCCLKTGSTNAWLLMSHYYPSKPPTAVISGDLTGTEGVEVSVSGARSSSPDGDALTYAWHFVAKPSASAIALDTLTTASIAFTPDVEGTYSVGLTVNDGVLNSSVATHSVTVSAALGGFVSDQIPVITLIGDAEVTVAEGSVYADAGATATDAEDDDTSLVVTSVSTVNTAVRGVYTVTYDVQDSFGNNAVTVIRTVTVAV